MIYIYKSKGFENMMARFFEKANLIVIAYDCSDRETFEDVPATIKRISETVGNKFKDKLILISTKCDVDQDRK
jgi:GTPase SAR1 family protein